MTSAGSPRSVPIYLVTVDSLRYDAVGAFGGNDGRGLTPNIDGLAADGVRFTEAAAAAPATIYSFLGSFTSTYPLDGAETTEGRPSLTAELSDVGYRTAGFHSNPFLSSHYGFDRGFEVFEDFTGASDDDADIHGRSGLGERIMKRVKSTLTAYPRVHDHAKELKNFIDPPYTRAGPITEAVLDDAGFGDDARTFHWVHYMDSHHPYYPEPEYMDLPFVPSLSSARRVRLAALIDVVKRDGADPDVSERDIRDLRALYDAQVHRVDDAVGRLLDGLKDAGVYDDALIVFASDHGDEFLEHGSLGHSPQLYDELVHVPLIIKPPADEPRKHVDTVDSSVSYLDLAPTILTMADAPVPEEMVGNSVARSLETGQTERDVAPSEFLHEDERLFSVRNSAWKFIRDEVHGREELYDLERDPHETNDVRAKESNQASQLRAFIDQRVDSVQAGAGSAYDDIDQAMASRLEDLGYL